MPKLPRFAVWKYNEVSSDKKDDTFADDSFFGMFDELGGGDQNNDNQIFDDSCDW